MFYRRLAGLVVFFWVCAGAGTGAQYFGKNKVHYETHDFRILQTDHFDLYYYPAEREAVEIAARLAERWYARLSRVLGHELRDRQPVILYGSHPDFAQTNVVSGVLGEEIGGVTESRRRRIVLPFTNGLREFDHVLGHELVHAFQFDIAEQSGRGGRLPLWFAEGMAEYLSVGSADPLAAMWIRDAIARDALPSLEDLVKHRVSPYRYGRMFWAYLAGRFGEDLIGESLRTKPTNDGLARIERLTRTDRDTLSEEWQQALRAEAAGERRPAAQPGRALVTSRQTGAALHLAPSISPDGRRIAFLSERDGFSIDLFLADARTGEIEARLVSTATDPHFDSLQFSRSSGDWDPTGRRFAIAAVRQGRPVLTLFDVAAREKRREIVFYDLGQIFNPSWSPDGRRLAFSGLRGGLSDLYVYDLETREVEQITDDAFSDLAPGWSPDGRRLAFVTDRYTTDLATLEFGTYEPAIVDVASRAIERVAVGTGADCVDPHWSHTGTSLYCVSMYETVSDIFNVDLASGATRRVTSVAAGVGGLTPTSPAMSVARDADRLVFSVYQRGGYDIYAIDPAAALDGRPLVDATPDDNGRQVADRRAGTTDGALQRSAAVVPSPGSDFVDRDYRPQLALDAIGQPYVSSGGGSFGAFLRGGISLSFDDMLRDRLMGLAVQVGSHKRDFGGRLQYLDRHSRWTWGVVAEQVPFARSRVGRYRTDAAPGRVTVETDRLFQIHRELTGVIAYPFNRAERIELRGGISAISFEREIQSRTYALATQRLVEEHKRAGAGGDPVRLGLAAIALVHDTSVFGVAGPILGQRYRFEVSPAVGDLSFVRVLADYRHYAMPVRPLTIAGRVLHVGRYGSDAADPRLEPYFVGYPGLVRGYRSGMLRRMACGADRLDGCDPLDPFTGSKMLVANLELRFPLLGLFSRRFTYGPFPIEGLAFADAGVAWSGTATRALVDGQRPLVRSVGAGVRVNAARMVVEVAAARHLGPLTAGAWTLSFNFGPAF